MGTDDTPEYIKERASTRVLPEASLFPRQQLLGSGQPLPAANAIKLAAVSTDGTCCTCTTAPPTSSTPEEATTLTSTTAMSESGATETTTQTSATFFSEKDELPTSATTETTTLTSVTSFDRKGACTMWGYPHIRTFDDLSLTFGESGTYPIVRSSRISIQAQYERIDFSETQGADGWMTSINVSGTFLQGHTLSFKAGLVVTADGGVFWDGAAILQGPEREVSLGSDLVLVTRTDDPVRSWQWLEPTDAARNAQSPGRLIISYDVTLPLGVVLTVNTVDWAPRYNLDMLLMMFPEPEGQSGHCGNFNGDKEDDGIPTMRRLGSQTCTTEAHANATAVCKANCGNVTAAFLEACAYDVCRAGPDVSISDCLIAWQTKVATSPTISQVTKLVGPGCCRPVMSCLARTRSHSHQARPLATT